MTVTVTVVIVAAVAALVVFGMSAVHALPELAAPERAVAREIERHPRLRRFLRQRLDRRRAGGLLLTVSLLVLFATALIVGLLLDLIDRSSALASLDRDVAEWGVTNADSVTVDVLRLVTHLGGTPVVIAAALATAIVDYLRNHRAEVFVFLATVVIGEKLILNGLKLIVDRDRPDLLQLVSHAGSSFPSGHTAAAAAVWPAVALVLSRGRPRQVRAALAAGAVLISIAVAASRAMLGVHWLSDVIAGLAVGLGWFLLCAVMFGGRAQRLGDPVSADPTGTTAEPESAAAHADR